jgi:hypothetical protein
VLWALLWGLLAGAAAVYSRLARGTALARWAPGLAAVVLVVGCAWLVTDDQPLPTYPPGISGVSSAVQGVLARDGSCLYLEGSDGERTIPYFPAFTTRWDEDKGRLWFLFGPSHRVGERVLFSGHTSKVPPSLRFRSHAPSCEAGTSGFAVVYGPGPQQPSP